MGDRVVGTVVGVSVGGAVGANDGARVGVADGSSVGRADLGEPVHTRTHKKVVVQKRDVSKCLGRACTRSVKKVRVDLSVHRPLGPQE